MSLKNPRLTSNLIISGPASVFLSPRTRRGVHHFALLDPHGSGLTAVVVLAVVSNPQLLLRNALNLSCTNHASQLVR